MWDSWTCVTIDKGPGVLPDELRTALKIAACEMYDDRKPLLRFDHTLGAGEIDTEWLHRMVGNRGGILFRARIETDDGEYQVQFLVNSDDLKRGAKRLKKVIERHGETWTYLPLETLGVIAKEFDDLRARPRRLN